MNRFRFIIKSLRHFKKQHFAVFLATLISTAVLTGALIVGDSVKYSLSHLVDKRLGNIEYTMLTGDRFLSSELAKKISIDLNTPAASILMLQGIAINTDIQKRINKTQIIGVDKDFWALSDIEMPELKANEIVISQNIAEKLSLEVGNEILVRIQNADVIPLNAPFTTDENQSIALRIKIIQIANDDELGRFSLRNNQVAPFNIFINREFLAEKLGLEGLSNIIVVADNSKFNADDLNSSLKNNWTLKDAGLKLNTLKNRDHFDLVSDRIFIDSPISKSISQLKIPNEKILTYFVNSFESYNNETPYSFVTAAPESYLEEDLSDNEIIINSWLADDLDAKIGDSLQIKYFVIGPLRTLEERTESFKIKNIIPVSGGIFNENLMPDFPGLSDAGSCSEWDTGIPIDLKKIRDKDEEYWDVYKGTPKAFISLEKGLELWENKFGNYTAIRFKTNEVDKIDLEAKILSSLNPKDLGLMFIDVRSEGKRAASSGVDFGELFLSLSFFVIAAAILLLVLIYSLNSESRMNEVGILFGLGFTKKQIIKLRISESLLTIILGAIMGGFAGILYNYLMISGLNSVWNDAVHADMLEVYVKPMSLIIGISIGIIASLLSIYFVSAGKLKKSVISIINNQDSSFKIKKVRFAKIIGSIGILVSLAIVLYSVFNSIEGNSGLMLLGGFLFLTGCTALFSVVLNPKNKAENSLATISTLNGLAVKNAGRNKNRSLAVVALLAIGTFTIIVTGANRKTFSGTEDQRSSGTGGFKLWVENTVPLLQNLNSPDGKKHYGLEDESALANANFVQFYSLAGDDASCLNLNQVQQPQILGINADLFDSLQAFSFANTINETANPWLELNRDYGHNIIPAYADQTVIQWGLLKSVGDTLFYHNEKGDIINLLLIGGLNASVFQGNILISDSAFIENFPGSSGSKIMLVDAPNNEISEVEDLLNNYLSDYGIEVNSTSARLASFYSVTNTYLTIFMILGGLGVILGTFGLGIVLMRIIIERKKEIAVFEALGFKKSQIFKLIFVENLILLSAGIIIGFISAIIGILPSILSSAFSISGNFLFVLVLIVFVSGMIWIFVPTWFSLRNKLIIGLQQN